MISRSAQHRTAAPLGVLAVFLPAFGLCAETVFQEGFESGAGRNGVADRCSVVGNPRIEARYSLDPAAHEGQCSQKIEVIGGTMAEQVGVQTAPASLKAGQEYAISLWYKTADLTDSDVFAFLGWYDEARRKFERFDLITNGRAGDWTEVRTFFKPEADLRGEFHLRLWVRKPGGTGKAWFDAVRIETASAAPSLVATRMPIPARKLIKCGWDTNGLTADFIQPNIRAMEEKPFDGIMFRLDKRYCHAFDTQPWPEADLKPIQDQLARIEWNRFTDNFLTLYSTNRGMDWFSDEHWKAITGNLRHTARAARAAKCKGIVFDTEPYGDSPWQYRGQFSQRPFAEAAAQVRRRGAQFMQALQGEMPDVKLFGYWMLSYFACYQPDILDETDATRVARLLSQDTYGLLVPFINGLLDAITPQAELVDGNEAAYYYSSVEDYYRGYFQVRQGALNLVAPENREKYLRQARVAQAVWQGWTEEGAAGYDVPGQHLDAPGRACLLEWKVYWSMRVADEYAWLYTDSPEWWRRPVPEKRTAVRDETLRAVSSAREKVLGRKPLGFAADGLFALVKRAREDRRRQTLTELVRREARIVPLASGAAGPRIDGSLDDPAWRGIRPLEGFVPCRKAAGAVPAATEVRATYDDKALYVFFRCGEPATDKLAAVGEQRDDDIWKGDVVEFFISLGESPSVYRHFMLNPKGVQWDAATGPAGEDVRWNGEWRGGARIGEREWTAEMAIPWECIGGAPKPGTARYANFCRCRRAGNELSTWSQVAERFQEPDAFGKMIFSVGG